MATLRLNPTYGAARVRFDEPFVPTIFQADNVVAFKIGFKDGEYVVTGQRNALKATDPQLGNHQIVVHPDTKARYTCYWWTDDMGNGFVWIEAR